MEMRPAQYLKAQCRIHLFSCYTFGNCFFVCLFSQPYISETIKWPTLNNFSFDSSQLKECKT